MRAKNLSAFFYDLRRQPGASRENQSEATMVILKQDGSDLRKAKAFINSIINTNIVSGIPGDRKDSLNSMNFLNSEEDGETTPDTKEKPII
jgi:hypothetical protein